LTRRKLKQREIETGGRTASIVECADPEKVYIEETIPKKVELDKVYFENVSVINDFKYIFITLFRIVKR